MAMKRDRFDGGGFEAEPVGKLRDNYGLAILGQDVMIKGRRYLSEGKLKNISRVRSKRKRHRDAAANGQDKRQEGEEGAMRQLEPTARGVETWR